MNCERAICGSSSANSVKSKGVRTLLDVSTDRIRSVNVPTVQCEHFDGISVKPVSDVSDEEETMTHSPRLIAPSM